MPQLKEAARAVFGEQGHNPAHAGDQTLLAAITAFNDLRKIDDIHNVRRTKHEGRVVVARMIYEALKKRVKEVNSSEMDEKFTRFKAHYAQEIKEISPSSGKDHRRPGAGRRDQWAPGRR